MLIITNGDSAVEALRAAGIEAEYLPWRAVLHDGPIPEGLDLSALSSVRATYLASLGWGEESKIKADFTERNSALEEFRRHSEVLLWFEHDLYDQLQLLQILDWFSRRARPDTRLTLICEAEFVAQSPARRLEELFDRRGEVPPTTLEMGWRAWAAVRSPTPQRSAALLESGDEGLPFVQAALLRFLEEYPAPGTGLARSERQILESLLPEPLPVSMLFHQVGCREEAAYLGDWSFWHQLRILADDAQPLIRREGDSLRPVDPSQPGSWREGDWAITQLGKEVLAGRQDRVRLLGMNKWLGGVHLRPGNIWRWDPQKGRVIRDQTQGF